jgi:hypothetical protein
MADSANPTLLSSSSPHLYTDLCGQIARRKGEPMAAKPVRLTELASCAG